MNEEEFRKILAENISFYRTNNGMTQAELADKLNYSDKSVSKWERGEGMPDAYVLSKIADLFGVTVNDLISLKKGYPKKSASNIKKIIIPILSVGLVWLVAAALFFISELIGHYFFTIPKDWLIFVYAIPASFIVSTIFSCLWWGLPLRAVSVSGIVWGTVLALWLTFSIDIFRLLLICAAILQVLIILWFYMMHRIKPQRENDL